MSRYSALLDDFFENSNPPTKREFQVQVNSESECIHPTKLFQPTIITITFSSVWIYTRVLLSTKSRNPSISDLSLPFSRRSRKSFASVYVYKHTYNINTQFRTHNTRDQRASIIEFSFSRTVVEKHNEIFVSFQGETFVFYPENGAKKIVWATGEDDFARRGSIIKKKFF